MGATFLGLAHRAVLGRPRAHRELREQAGVYLLPTIWSHGQLRGPGHPWGEGWWYNNAYASLCDAEDFFETGDSPQWRYQRNFYRYLIARWGYSRAIVGWVAVCEMEGTSGYLAHPAQAEAWCSEVRDCFRQLDPFRRDLTDRYPLAATKVDSPMWDVGLDMRATDSYAQRTDDVNVASTIATQTGLMLGSGSPCFHAEFGGDTEHGASQPAHLHNGVWAGVAAGAALAPLVWCDGGNYPMLTPAMLRQLGHLADFLCGLGYAASPSLGPASVEVDAPSCRAWGLCRLDRGFAWVQDISSSLGGEELTVSGLPAGGYTVRWYDVWTSGTAPVSTGTVSVGPSGELVATIPSAGQSDIACSFVRTSAQDHLLSVGSTPVRDVEVGGSLPGVTPYTAACADELPVALNAPRRRAGMHFQRWLLDGQAQALGLSAVQFLMNADREATAVYASRLPLSRGVCYGPYTRPGQAPGGAQPTREQLRQELQAIAAYFTPLLGAPPTVRTYGVSGILSDIPALASEVGMRSMPGAWLGADPAANRQEVARLVQLIQQQPASIESVIVGNETDASGCSNAELLASIAQVRAVAEPFGIPVTSAQSDAFWLDPANAAVMVPQ